MCRSAVSCLGVIVPNDSPGAGRSFVFFTCRYVFKGIVEAGIGLTPPQPKTKELFFNRKSSEHIDYPIFTQDELRVYQLVQGNKKAGAVKRPPGFKVKL